MLLLYRKPIFIIVVAPCVAGQVRAAARSGWHWTRQHREATAAVPDRGGPGLKHDFRIFFICFNFSHSSMLEFSFS